MTDASPLVKMLANFFFFLMAIFFPDPRTPSDGYFIAIRSLPDTPFRQHYWNTLANTSNVTYSLPNVNELIPFDHGLLVFSQEGTLWNVKISDAAPVVNVTRTLRIVMPPDVNKRGGIWHAAIDSLTGRLFLTVVEKEQTGVFYTENIRPILANNDTNELGLKLFVRSTGDREFQGIEVDPRRRILFVAEKSKYDKSNGSIVLWSLKDDSLLQNPPTSRKLVSQVIAKINANAVFRPWGLALYRDNLAVTDHSNHTIHLFKIVTEKGDPECAQPIHFKTIATMGRGLGDVMDPWGISFDPAGNLLVADRGNKRVQVFRPTDEEFTEVQPVWQSEPVLPFNHLKTVAAVVITEDQSDIRIVAAMFPSKLVIFKP